MRNVCESKKDFMNNLRACFEGQGKVHVSDIAIWVGKKSATIAQQYADAEGFINLKGVK